MSDPEKGSSAENAKWHPEKQSVEPSEVLERTQSAEILTAVNRVESEIDGLEKEANRSELPPAVKESLLTSAQQSLYRFARGLTLATALWVGGTEGYKVARGRTTEVQRQEQNGLITYAHSDKETTHVLNVITGKEKMTETEIRASLLEHVRHDADFLRGSSYIQPPPNFEKMNHSEAVEWAAQTRVGLMMPWPEVDVPGVKDQREILQEMTSKQLRETLQSWGLNLPHDFEKMTKTERVEWGHRESFRTSRNKALEYEKKHLENDILASDKDTFNRKLYVALWELESEVGAPLIKITAGQWKVRSDAGGWYDPVTNTIYLRLISFRPGEDTVVAEMAHAKQFREKPVSETIESAKSAIRMGVKIVKGTPPGEAQRAEYERPGSVEYEAHKVIEPELRKKIERLYDEPNPQTETDSKNRDF